LSCLREQSCAPLSGAESNGQGNNGNANVGMDIYVAYFCNNVFKKIFFFQIYMLAESNYKRLCIALNNNSNSSVYNAQEGN